MERKGQPSPGHFFPESPIWELGDAPLSKCLLYKHEDLNSDPSTQVKTGMVLCTYDPRAGGSLGLAGLSAEQLVRLCLKTKGKE